jgi:hypothetical protein
MAKVFGIHEIELQLGVEPDAYERFSPKRSSRRLNSQGGRSIF